MEKRTLDTTSEKDTARRLPNIYVIVFRSDFRPRQKNMNENGNKTENKNENITQEGAEAEQFTDIVCILK